MNIPKILIIDDEISIRKLLRLTLEAVPYTVIEAATGRDGLHLLATEKPSLVVLDMGLPDRHGKEVLKELRSWSETPVVVLSVEKDSSTIVDALNLGADDYVTKPFINNELLARIHASLRRTLYNSINKGVVRIRNIEIDLDKRVVKKSGQIVHLTSLEYEFFSYLVHNQGKIVTHSQILKAVWGPLPASDSSYPRVYMRHLRQKLENNPDEPEIFLTETGMGYRLVE